MKIIAVKPKVKQISYVAWRRIERINPLRKIRAYPFVPGDCEEKVARANATAIILPQKTWTMSEKIERNMRSERKPPLIIPLVSPT